MFARHEWALPRAAIDRRDAVCAGKSAQRAQNPCPRADALLTAAQGSGILALPSASRTWIARPRRRPVALITAGSPSPLCTSIARQHPMKRRATLSAFIAFSLIPIANATAQLVSFGPVSAASGFPQSYTDGQGTTLTHCLSNGPLCLLDAAVELLNADLPFPANFGGLFPDESFYWAGEAAMPT